MASWLFKLHKLHFSTGQLQRNAANFGLLFDIDGVIVKGSRVLPPAVKAFECLTDDNGNFRVPTLFVTNAGSVLPQTKADQLSYALGVTISPEQVIMSHSPLKMFKDYHHRHVLAVGQGPVKEIAKHNGFNRVSTIDDVRAAFPTLDAVDHQRRKSGPFDKHFTPIDSVVLLGEP